MKLSGFSKKILIIVLLFFIFQLLSFLAYLWPNISSAIFFLIVFIAIGLAWYKIEYGFLVLVFEFFSGHGGHLFEFSGISLRLTLFMIVMFIWLIRKIAGQKQWFVSLKKISPFYILFLLLLFFILFGLGRGLVNNNPVLAIKDFINYSYFLLIFPLVDILRTRRTFHQISTIAQAATIGIAFLTIIVLILFAANLVEVHNIFYWWWRGVVIGKATFAGNNFFRIVTPAHLLILPLFLVYLSLLAGRGKGKAGIKKQKKIVWLAVLASLAILINFSRAYLLGLLAGLIFLARGLNWRRWLAFSLVVVVILAAEFVLIYAIVSGGQVLASLKFLGFRAETVVSPEEELSSSTRLAILPRLKEKIIQQPILGTGLGTTVSYLDPLTNQPKTTFHLDWGYLEIWLELGLLGLLSYLSILFFIFYQGWRKITVLAGNVLKKRILIGLLAGLISIAVATLTGPFLFHPLGIFCLTFTAAVIIVAGESQPVTDVSKK